MKARCSNPAHEKFPIYGGRGIVVCKRWQDFANFHADMGPRPTRQHSLERLERDGNYEPGNVIWATNEVQANNRSSTRMLTLNGETKSLTMWAKQFGVDRRMVTKRLRKGLTLEQSLLPSNKPKNRSAS
jgi:hypothetical protein